MLSHSVTRGGPERQSIADGDAKLIAIGFQLGIATSRAVWTSFLLKNASKMRADVRTHHVQENGYHEGDVQDAELAVLDTHEPWGFVSEHLIAIHATYVVAVAAHDAVRFPEVLINSHPNGLQTLLLPNWQICGRD